MMFKDDRAVIAMLYRSGSVMKPLGQTFSSYCQWCGQQRAAIKPANVLMCPTCDQGDR